MTIRANFVELAKAKVGSDPISNAPFPQADSMERIIGLSKRLVKFTLTVDDVSSYMEFTNRQSSYYLAACSYLGLATKNRFEGKVQWSASTTSMKIYAKEEIFWRTQLCSLILSIDSCAQVFLELQADPRLQQSRVFKIFDRSKDSLYTSGETTRRRAQTVLAWSLWVENQIQLIE